ncbi:tripartite tricarboxylate transporter TctB family protein [Nesterenkonia muleiensis]|uniref:tripartite tricarboxylate transporter TctB family protein n=1 Tax=Nesterenkonia muleiensis TaxID=2282648 RepID=UPI000E759A25|nr:tripartite tricarboxylate transporter TctB family protein [Nesterenkonia muleiensis]
MNRTSRRQRLQLEPLVWTGLGVVALIVVIAGVPASTATALQTPRFWPTAAAVIMLVAGLLIASNALAGSRRALSDPVAAQPQDSSGKPAAADPEVLRRYNHLLLIGIIAAYVAALPYLGYVVATFVMAWVLAWTIGVRKILSATLASITYVALTTVIFGILMNVPLPRGRGPFVEISTFFF